MEYYSSSYYCDTNSTGSTSCSTTTSTITDATYWYYYTPTDYYYSIPTIQINQEPKTEEQRQTRYIFNHHNILEAQKRYNAEQERLRKERDIAIRQAEELLKENIGLEAFGKLHEVGYIEVDSQKYKGRKYHIPEECTSRIEVLDSSGKVIDRLCVHPAIECPAGDHILTRKVLLELDEDYILNRSIHSPVVVY